MSFFKNVLANTAGGILVVFLMWLFELWSAAWDAAKFFWHLIFKSLIYELSAPVWQILALVLAIKFAQLQIQKYKNKKTKLKEIEAESKKLQLTKNEDLVVRMLVDVDGRWLKTVDMTNLLGISRLLVEQAIEGLLKKQFIDDRYNMAYGASYRLSSFGRDYVIENGCVQQHH